MPVHRGTDIPEVQVVPRQQAGGEKGFTQEKGDLATGQKKPSIKSEAKK